MATFKNVLSTSITTETSVLTATIATTIIGLTIANTSASPVTASIVVTSGATSAYLVKDILIPVGNSVVPIGGEQKVVLEINDILKISASGTVDAIVSYLEI